MIEFRLAHMMVERGMKGKDLAIAVGITARSVSRLKNRRNPKLIDAELLDKLCEALNCEAGELIRYKKN